MHGTQGSQAKPAPKSKAKADPAKLAIELIMAKQAHERTMADALAIPTGREVGFGNGLNLRVQGSSRTWSVKVSYTKSCGTKAERKRIEIGNVNTLDVDPGRALAIDIFRWARAGLDVERELAKVIAARTKIPTFGQHATAFMDRHVPTLKNENHQDKWRASLKNHVEPRPIWSTPVDEVVVADVLAVLDPIWKTIPVMASEVRSRIEMILGDAANRYGVTRLQNFNPARWTKDMRASLGSKPPKSGATRGSHKSVPYKQIPALMIELRERKTQTARAIYAIVLTGLRWQEFVKMQKCELDLDNAEQPTWTIPYSRFKVDPHKQDYVVPLSPQLVDILREHIAELEEIYGADNVDYIWPSSLQGTRGDRSAKDPHISSSTMLSYLQKSMKRDATIHGFRGSFETWGGAQFAPGTDSSPKYLPHALDCVLAHIDPGGKTKSVYRSGMMYEARIPVMRDWANHCAPPHK